ncbi:MAG: glycosyltransferase family 4 protein, partial [Candidatus Saccharimonadales bacterium]
MYPYRFENLAYGEFEKTKGYPFKVLLYTVSEFYKTLLICLRRGPKSIILNPRWLIPQGFVGVMLKLVLRCPVVVSVHGADVFTLNGAVMLKIKRFVLKHADSVVVNSTTTKGICMDLWPRDDYVICPTGADTSKFKQPKRLTKKSKNFEVLFVGRLVEQKGVLYLCEAIRLLANTDSQTRLTIVGDGSARLTVEEYITSHQLEDRIKLTGWVQPENLPPYYARADVFVGPSIDNGNGWKEGFGTVFAEASAMGLPIIATKTGGIKDVVKDGVTGLLVKQKDARALASAILKLEKEPELRQKLAKQGPDFIEQNYSLNVTTSKYLAIFNSLA